MKNDLIGKPKKYTLDHTIENRYMKAVDGYADRYGRLTIEKKNWQMAFGASILCLIVSIGGNIYQGTQSKIVPYITVMDGQTGALLSVGKATDQQKPTEKQISYFLWEIVKKSRTLSKDPVVYKTNWEDVYAFFTRETSNKINDMAAQSSHKEKLEKGFTTQLTMKSFMPIKDNTYQIRWQEVLYDKTGKVISETMMEALFTIKQGEIEERKAYANPLGLIVTDFTWSQERS